MAQRYFMQLSYNGAPFHGWQVQPNAVSVQELVEDALSKVCGREMHVTGAGRTDTGVNARIMYAHFDVDDKFAEKENIIRRLNSILGRDIVVEDLIEVPEDAHARFDATSRTYKYFVHLKRSPFLYSHSWYCHYNLDFEKMNEAAAKMLEYTDFTSFSKLHTDVFTNNCKVTYAKWAKEGEYWVFTVTADRFLRNMVRAIVGTLVEVGRGKLTVEEFCKVIEMKNRCQAGTSMPGNALFLWKVAYPYIE